MLPWLPYTLCRSRASKNQGLWNNSCVFCVAVKRMAEMGRRVLKDNNVTNREDVRYDTSSSEDNWLFEEAPK